MANMNSWAQKAPSIAKTPSPKSEASSVSDVDSESIRYQESLYKARGVAADYDRNTYGMTSYAYPQDLMSSATQYGDNYVVFYINVAKDSKLLATGAEDIVESGFPPRDVGSTVANANKYEVGGAALGLATVGPAAVAGTIKSAGTGAKIAGAGAVGGYALGQLAATTTGSTKRIRTTIALHMPNQMSTRYGINYEEDGMDLFTAGLALKGAPAAITEAIQKKSGGDVSKQGGAAAAAIALSSPDKLGLSSTSGIQKLTRMAPNPRKEQIFKSVDFRTFQFNYEFYPRDESEAQAVLNIIHQFKLHMHPEFKDTNEFLYIYPSEFDIFYYHGVQENLNVNRHTSCVLTEMTINYSPQGQFTTFDNGMPTQININMTFKELALLTKEKIQDHL